MSWMPKVYLLSVLAVYGFAVHAARIELSGYNNKAEITTNLKTNQNLSLSPVDIRLVIPSLDLNHLRDGFDEIRIDGLQPLEEEGNPALFTTGALLFVPEGYTPELQVIRDTTKGIQNVVVTPSQRKWRCEMPNSFHFNSDLYESNEIYPQQAFYIEEVGRLAGLRLIRVAMNPVQMDMGRQNLTVHYDVELNISFRKVGPVQIEHFSPSIFELARAVTVNGSELKNFAMRDMAERMLIVVADRLKEDITPLVKWKREKGFQVDVASFSEAGGSKEAVKKYIQNAYSSSALSHLIFIGNKTTMPGFMESTGSGSAATDYTYALLSGNDEIPDVHYGRILADDRNELMHQMNRWLSYEMKPEKGATWYSSGVTIASNEQLDGPSDKEYAEQVRDGLKAGTYQNFDVFLQGENNATPNNIVSALNKGRSWLTYFGHGNGTSWGSTNGSFSNSTIATLRNINQMPFIVDVACLNASWVNLSKPFGRAWVTHSADGQEAGAVAYYGGSVSISWDPPAVMAVGIAKYHVEKRISHVGGSVLAGQLYLIEKMGKNSKTIDNLKWYNLFGDPSMEMRTATPIEYQVNYSVLLGGENRKKVMVQTTDSGGKAVSGILVALSQGSQPVAVGRTNSAGKISLDFQWDKDNRDALITTTGYNMGTYQKTIKVW